MDQLGRLPLGVFSIGKYAFQEQLFAYYTLQEEVEPARARRDSSDLWINWVDNRRLPLRVLLIDKYAFHAYTLQVMDKISGPQAAGNVTDRNGDWRRSTFVY
jgi:hypothetical protein